MVECKTPPCHAGSVSHRRVVSPLTMACVTGLQLTAAATLHKRVWRAVSLVWNDTRIRSVKNSKNDWSQGVVCMCEWSAVGKLVQYQVRCYSQRKEPCLAADLRGSRASVQLWWGPSFCSHHVDGHSGEHCRSEGCIWVQEAIQRWVGQDSGFCNEPLMGITLISSKGRAPSVTQRPPM